jgi:hypothetical protein
MEESVHRTLVVVNDENGSFGWGLESSLGLSSRGDAFGA